MARLGGGVASAPGKQAADETWPPCLEQVRVRHYSTDRCDAGGQSGVSCSGNQGHVPARLAWPRCSCWPLTVLAAAKCGTEMGAGRAIIPSGPPDANHAPNFNICVSNSASYIFYRLYCLFRWPNNNIDAGMSMYFSSTSLPYLFHFPYPCLFFIFLILFSHHTSICFSVYFFIYVFFILCIFIF